MDQVVIIIRAELAQETISSGQEEKVTTGPRESVCLETLNAKTMKLTPGPASPGSLMWYPTRS